MVSHGHGASVGPALESIHAQLGTRNHRFVLTLNAGERATFVQHLSPTLRRRLQVIRNETPRGFGANHNAALRNADTRFVLIADPDLSVESPIFGALEAALEDPRSGIVAPLAQAPDGRVEDNGRALITPRSLLARYLLIRRWRRPPEPVEATRRVDWIAGLFMAMRAETFHTLRGFDERYFLYCEDVDLSLRAAMHGLHAVLLQDLRVTHLARRRSLKRPQHLRWHVQSMLRLWRSEAYRSLRKNAQDGRPEQPASGASDPQHNARGQGDL